ncbi:hypothetical protein OAH21_00255 [bacterium]|nr:hypothetical protein [bacterium]
MKFSTGILTLLSLPLFADEDQSTSPEGERFQLFAGEQELDLEYEGLLSNEIEVQRAAMRYSQRRGLWRTDIGASMTDYSIDYQPFAPLGGLPTGLSETTQQFNLSASYALSGSVESSLAFSHYDGFADFRSIWIAEYYRQAFNFPGSGYQAPDPHGFSIVSGWVWDPKPGNPIFAGSHLRGGHDCAGLVISRSRERSPQKSCLFPQLGAGDQSFAQNRDLLHLL